MKQVHKKTHLLTVLFYYNEICINMFIDINSIFLQQRLDPSCSPVLIINSCFICLLILSVRALPFFPFVQEECFMIGGNVLVVLSVFFFSACN